MRLVFYQLEYLEYEHFEDCQTRTEQWLFLFKHLSTMGPGEIDIEKLKQEFKDFVDSARYEQMNEAEQHAYDMAYDNYYGIIHTFEDKYNNGLKDGIEQGIRQGIEQGKELERQKYELERQRFEQERQERERQEQRQKRDQKERAADMKADGLPVETIIRYTGLTSEEIQNL